MAQAVAFHGDHVHTDLSECVNGVHYEGPIGLRIVATFVVLATSIFATLFPIVTKRMRRLDVPNWVYDTTCYFGSGVILSTALMHLLEPAADD